MKNDMIHTLTESFEGHAQQTENGIEYWLARDLQHLLGYSKWDNFLNAISKAKTACEVSNHDIADHFADVGKMVELGSGSQSSLAKPRYSSRKPTPRRRCEKGRTAFDIGGKESAKKSQWVGRIMGNKLVCFPLLNKLAQGRDNSGLAAYE